MHACSMALSKAFGNVFSPKQPALAVLQGAVYSALGYGEGPGKTAKDIAVHILRCFSFAVSFGRFHCRYQGES